ncbi:MAG TPA: glycosyltransferase family 9 protein [Longimicrobiales bacterium]|nr:glycosyltransferase family 9 protein [Longimicrobiales bacterium]
MTALKRVLLIQLNYLGDVILATPTARALRAAAPGARIDFVTTDLGAQALEDNPHIDLVLVYPKLSFLRRNNYDAVFDMHSVPRSALYTAATGARVRVGIRGRGPRNLAYTELHEKEHGAVYMARQKMRLLTSLGVNHNIANASLVLSVTDAQRRWAEALLEQKQLYQPVIALSPVAKHEYKQWGAKNWAAVGDALADMGASILITSGPGEEKQAEAVANAMRFPAVWQYGGTSVRELGALYQQCKLWVGNDGGPKHIATAVGTPTVTVYREALGEVWSDSDSTKQVIINAGEAQPVASILPERVIAAASRFVK